MVGGDGDDNTLVSIEISVIVTAIICIASAVKFS